MPLPGTSRFIKDEKLCEQNMLIRHWTVKKAFFCRVREVYKYEEEQGKPQKIRSKTADKKNFNKTGTDCIFHLKDSASIQGSHKAFGLEVQ